MLPKRSAKWALGLQCGLFLYLSPHLVHIGVKKWAFSPSDLRNTIKWPDWIVRLYKWGNTRQTCKLLQSSSHSFQIMSVLTWVTIPPGWWFRCALFLLDWKVRISCKIGRQKVRIYLTNFSRHFPNFSKICFWQHWQCMLANIIDDWGMHNQW